MSPRHVSVTGSRSLFVYERCDHEECVVSDTGLASCGATACPSCGSGGANVSEQGGELSCTCGAVWVIAAERAMLAQLR